MFVILNNLLRYTIQNNLLAYSYYNSYTFIQYNGHVWLKLQNSSVCLSVENVIWKNVRDSLKFCIQSHANTTTDILLAYMVINNLFLYHVFVLQALYLVFCLYFNKFVKFKLRYLVSVYINVPIVFVNKLSLTTPETIWWNLNDMLHEWSSISFENGSDSQIHIIAVRFINYKTIT